MTDELEPLRNTLEAARVPGPYIILGFSRKNTVVGQALTRKQTQSLPHWFGHSLKKQVSLKPSFFNYEASGMRWSSCSLTKKCACQECGEWVEDPEGSSEQSQFGMTYYIAKEANIGGCCLQGHGLAKAQLGITGLLEQLGVREFCHFDPLYHSAGRKHHQRVEDRSRVTVPLPQGS